MQGRFYPRAMYARYVTRHSAVNPVPRKCFLSVQGYDQHHILIFFRGLFCGLFEFRDMHVDVAVDMIARPTSFSFIVPKCTVRPLRD